MLNVTGLKKMSQIKVIITEDKVYTTFFKTIHAKIYFGGDVTREQAETDCKSLAFSLACTDARSTCSIIDWSEKHVIDQDIFDYLETTHLKK